MQFVRFPVGFPKTKSTHELRKCLLVARPGIEPGTSVDIMGELQGLTPDQIQALIEMVKKNKL